jgi:O-antigen/teichoic acid export membrane protein
MWFIQTVKNKYAKIAKKKTFKSFAAVTISSFALKPIGFLREFFVAKYLNPEYYGILKSLEMIHMLNKFGSLGFNAAASREAGHYQGLNQIEKAEQIKSVAYTSELILTTILFIAGVIYGYYFQNKYSTYVLIASLGLFTLKVSGIYDTEAIIRKSFVKYSFVTFISGVITAVCVIFAVPYFSINAVLAGSVISGLATIVLYAFWLKFHILWRFEFKIFKNILRISLPLSFATFVYGLYKYSERILILYHLDKIALGFFGFAETITNSLLIFIKTFIKVRTQDLYEYLGQRKFNEVHRIVVRETFYLCLASLVIIPIVYFSAKIFIPWLLPKWIEGIQYINLFMFMLFAQALPNHVFVVISSSIVNKQIFLTLTRLLSIVILYTCVYVSIYFNALSLKLYILIDIFANIGYAISLIIVYRIFFYNVYVKVNGNK